MLCTSPKSVDSGTGLYSPTGHAKRCVFSDAGGGWKRGFWHTRDSLLQISPKPTSGQRHPWGITSGLLVTRQEFIAHGRLSLTQRIPEPDRGCDVIVRNA